MISIKNGTELDELHNLWCVAEVDLSVNDKTLGQQN